MSKWIEYTGDNPPTEEEKHLLVERFIAGPNLCDGLTFYEAGSWEGYGEWRGLVRYMYIDPYEPPLPNCWCGAKARSVQGAGYWEVCCSRYPSHLSASGRSRTVAESNWRNGRNG